MGSTGSSLKQMYARGVGGGPSASHNYTRGLMLAYFLTGNPIYRNTAIDLARFVVAIDKPRKLLRILSNEYTGLATLTGADDYHGPGRASGNSILALVVGHRLTGEKTLLDKAEQLIRRCTHPQQNLESLDLLNAELRWFYTMHLQAIGEYLDHKSELCDFDSMFNFARQTLLHYARWMATHERPILDTPEQLQYPTETWAAQDIRKFEVFQYAARYCEADERERFLERANWFFEYVVKTLQTFPTKTYCRPMVLMMNHGWSRAWWQLGMYQGLDPRIAAMSSELPTEWKSVSPFVPQKKQFVQRAKILIQATAAVTVALIIGLLYRVFGTW